MGADIGLLRNEQQRVQDQRGKGLRALGLLGLVPAVEAAADVLGVAGEGQMT